MTQMLQLGLLDKAKADRDANRKGCGCPIKLYAWEPMILVGSFRIEEATHGLRWSI